MGLIDWWLGWFVGCVFVISFRSAVGCDSVVWCYTCCFLRVVVACWYLWCFALFASLVLIAVCIGFILFGIRVLCLLDFLWWIAFGLALVLLVVLVCLWVLVFCGLCIVAVFWVCVCLLVAPDCWRLCCVDVCLMLYLIAALFD